MTRASPQSAGGGAAPAARGPEPAEQAEVITSRAAHSWEGWRDSGSAWTERPTWGEPQGKRRAWVHAGSGSEDSLATEDASETHDALPPIRDEDGGPPHSLEGTTLPLTGSGMAGPVGHQGQDLVAQATASLGEAGGHSEAT